MAVAEEAFWTAVLIHRGGQAVKIGNRLRTSVTGAQRGLRNAFVLGSGVCLDERNE